MCDTMVVTKPCVGNECHNYKYMSYSWHFLQNNIDAYLSVYETQVFIESQAIPTKFTRLCCLAIWNPLFWPTVSDFVETKNQFVLVRVTSDEMKFNYQYITRNMDFKYVVDVNDIQTWLLRTKNQSLARPEHV